MEDEDIHKKIDRLLIKRWMFSIPYVLKNTLPPENEEPEEDEELDRVYTPLGCRQILQYSVILEEAYNFFEKKNADLPSMDKIFSGVIKDFCPFICRFNSQVYQVKPLKRGLVGDLRDIDRVEGLLLQFFKKVGQLFFCFLCEEEVTPFGQYPSISCPHCKGWYLIEISPETKKLPYFGRREILMSRLQFPNSAPELSVDSLHPIQPENSTQCLICFEYFLHGVMELSCRHRYCEVCIKKWFVEQYDRRTCPTCSELMLTDSEPFNIYVRAKHRRNAKNR